MDAGNRDSQDARRESPWKVRLGGPFVWRDRRKALRCKGSQREGLKKKESGPAADEGGWAAEETV